MSLRQQNKARARASILNAAATLIAERGASAATTREIARQAGVSYQTLYNYFPSKAHIVRALIDADLQTWSDQVGQLIKHYDGNLLSTLATINEICFSVMRGDRLELWREVMAQFANWRDREDEEYLATLSLMAHERIYALLSMAQGVRELEQDIDLHLLAHTIFCLTDYAVLRYFLARCADDTADQAAHQQTLQEQLILVIRPYLRNAESGATHPSTN